MIRFPNPYRWTHVERFALAAWLILFVVVSVRVFVSRPRSHNDYSTYANTGRNWLAGQDLYYQYDEAGNYDDFRYSPLVAAVFAGFTAVSDPVSNVLWRGFSLIMFAIGLAWWGRRLVFSREAAMECSLGRKPQVPGRFEKSPEGATETPSCAHSVAPSGLRWTASSLLPGAHAPGYIPSPLSGQSLAILFLLVIPLTATNVNNGQVNLIVLGSLLAGTAALADKRWMLAAGFLAFATLFKVYPAAIALLLIAVYPRQLGWRFPLALSVGVLIPYALHDAGYVSRQYGAWMGYWFQEDREVNVGQVLYRDLRLVFRVWLEPLDGKVYLAIQLLIALAAAAICVAAKRAGWPDRRLLPLLFGLGCCWMTVFGVSAEACTYVLVAPSLAGALIQGYLERRPLGVQIWFWASFGIFLASGIAKWFPRGAEVLDNRASDPIAGLLLLVGLLVAEIPRTSKTAEDCKPADLPMAA